MQPESWLNLIQTLSVLLAIALSVSSLRVRGDERAGTLAKMQADIEHIKKSVDTIAHIRHELIETRAQLRAESQRIDEHLRCDRKLERAGQTH